MQRASWKWILGLSSFLLVVACDEDATGDDVATGDDDDTPGAGSSGVTSSSSSGGSGTTGDSDLVEGAQARIFNFYSPAASQGTTLDFRRGYSGEARDATAPFLTVPYDHVSDYFVPNESGLGTYVNGQPPATGVLDNVMSREGFQAGDRRLVVIMPDPRDDGRISVAWQTLPEDGQYALAAVPGRAVIRVAPATESAIDYRYGEVQNYFLGAPGGGCVGGADTPLIGGTPTNTFDLDPGEMDLTFYNDDACAGPPAFASQHVTLAAGSRSHVLIGGTTLSDLHAVVIPIPD